MARANDILPVLDEWAFKFYREMDYRKEVRPCSQPLTPRRLRPLPPLIQPLYRPVASCAAGRSLRGAHVVQAAMMERFQEDLASLDGIMVPSAFDAYTTRRVLCTQWIDGEKLSESRAEDVKELCTTLLNAYLIQLLDTGLLHADPHPGNLIRTPDGKICILDFGAQSPRCANERLRM